MTRDDGVGSRDGTASLLGDDVYWRLRQEIVRGELRPNQALAEADIAERLKVARTPVRVSMQRLAADGLVISRWRRWVVYEPSKQEIQEIYEVRDALEGYAARLGSGRISDEQIAELSRLRSSIKTWSGLNGRVEQNDTLHNSIVAIGGSPPELGKRQNGCAFHPRCAFAQPRCATDVPPLIEIGGGRTLACPTSWRRRRLHERACERINGHSSMRFPRRAQRGRCVSLLEMRAARVSYHRSGQLPVTSGDAEQSANVSS